MLPRSRPWFWSFGVLALAGCSDDDNRTQIVVDAGEVGSADATQDAGSTDASAANCSGQDAITQLLCQFGLTGTGADGGLGGFTDIINSLGGLSGLGGAFGGTTPTPAQCANPSDQLTRFLCGGDGGAGPRRTQDAGRPPPPPIDAGAPYDAGASVQDTGAVALDAELVDSGTVEDASFSDADATLPDTDGSQSEGDQGDDDAGGGNDANAGDDTGAPDDGGSGDDAGSG